MSVAEDATSTAENVTLQFAKVDFEYKPQKADGSLDVGLHFKYDIKANRARLARADDRSGTPDLGRCGVDGVRGRHQLCAPEPACDQDAAVVEKGRRMKGATNGGPVRRIERPAGRVSTSASTIPCPKVGRSGTDPANDQDAAVRQERCGMTLAAHLQGPGRAV